MMIHQLRVQATVLLLLLTIALGGCVRSPKQKMEWLLAKGKESYAEHDYQRAILRFRGAIQVQPRSAEPYYQLGLAYLASGEVRGAVMAFWQAAERDPKHVEAQLKLAELLLKSGEQDLLEEVQKRVQDVRAVAPANLDALDLQALTEWRLGKKEEAEHHLQQVLTKSPADLKASINLAMAKLSRKDVLGAEEILKKAAQTSPTPNALIALGEFYVMIDRLGDAEQQLIRTLKVDSKNPLALIDLAALQVRAGRKDQAERTYTQLSALPDKQYKPIHALFLFASGQTDTAIAELEKLQQQDPQDRDARTRLVTAYLQANRAKDAEKVLSNALQKNERDVEALLQRSRVYIDAGKYTEAQNDLNKVLHFEPYSAKAHYYLAKVHQAKGTSLSYRQELGEAVRLDRAFLTARIELAQALIASKGAKSALEVMDEAPPWQQKLLPAIVQRNWSLLASGDRSLFRQGVNQGLRLARTPDLLIQDAMLKTGEQNVSGARASLEEALRISPGNVQALNLLVRTYIAQKQTPVALQKVREFAVSHPEYAAIQEYWGESLLVMGDRAQARVAFAAAKRAQPDFTPAELALSRLDAMEGNFDGARKRLSALLASNRANNEAREVLAGVEQAAGNQSAAIDQYRTIADSEPNNIRALNNLAYLLADANKADEALNYAQRAKELLPGNLDVEDTLGWVLYRKGLYAVAVQHLENSAPQEPTGRGQFHLAMAYFKAGDLKRGKQTLRAALVKYPNLPEAKLAEQVQAEMTQ